MNNKLQIFNNPDFGEIRTLDESGAVLFCGSDVAKALGYTNPSKALSDHCKGVTKRYAPTKSGMQEMSFIPESDLYRLVFGSKLPTAEKFTDWVTREILPSIRRHGAYMTPDALNQMISSPEFGIRLLTELKAEQDRRRELENKIAADAPAVRFANALTECETNILVRDLAKLLKQNGVDTGEKRLYWTLRNDGYLIKSGSDYNMPTQKSVDLGLFFVKETPRISRDGAVLDRVTKVTPKGQKYFLNRYAAPRKAPALVQ